MRCWAASEMIMARRATKNGSASTNLQLFQPLKSHFNIDVIAGIENF
jgi:hypothetical protein